MRIALGADHAGLALKKQLVEWLSTEGHEVTDLGTYTPDSCDYPVFGRAVAEEILAGRAERGILVCGSGIGMAVAANRFKGIRAANCTDLYSAEMSRSHNDSNVLALGARIIAPELALIIAKKWLETPFQGGRHINRLELLDR